MKYHVGDIVSVNVEILKDKNKKISIVQPREDSEIEIMNFPIVAVDKVFQLYKIMIDQDIYGWYISKFHIKHQDIDAKLIGRKFYDITESLILNVISNEIIL